MHTLMFKRNILAYNNPSSMGKDFLGFLFYESIQEFLKKIISFTIKKNL